MSINRIRKERNLTFRQMAEEVGISASRLCRLEKSGAITKSAALKIQAAYGLSDLETAQLIMGKQQQKRVVA